MGDHGDRRAWAILITLGLGPAAMGLGRAEPGENGLAATGIRNRIDCPMTRASLDRVAEGTFRRLRSPKCERVFSDFRDSTGHTLAHRLEAKGQTGTDYLANRMWFVDGSGAWACQDSTKVFVTKPGSAVVFVCARQLRRLAFYDPAVAEAMVIHEELHSLGLEENPPSADEITIQVQRRCGRR